MLQKFVWSCKISFFSAENVTEAPSINTSWGNIKREFCKKIFCKQSKLTFKASFIQLSWQKKMTEKNWYLQKRVINIQFLRIINVTMQNICSLIGWNRVHISIFNCYRANIIGMWNARRIDGIYKTFEFTAT